MSKVTPQQAEELRWLHEQPETEIDTADIPEVNDWSDVRQSVFYRLTVWR